MPKKITQEAIDNLKEIQGQMTDLLEEAAGIIRMNGSRVDYERFKGYVQGHIATALSNDHNFLSKNMFTLEGIISDLEANVEPEEDEDEEEEEEEHPMDDNDAPGEGM
jgi:hypothetical protein